MVEAAMFSLLPLIPTGFGPALEPVIYPVPQNAPCVSAGMSVPTSL